MRNEKETKNKIPWLNLEYLPFQCLRSTKKREKKENQSHPGKIRNVTLVNSEFLILRSIKGKRDEIILNYFDQNCDLPQPL